MKKWFIYSPNILRIVDLHEFREEAVKAAEHYLNENFFEGKHLYILHLDSVVDAAVVKKHD